MTKRKSNEYKRLWKCSRRRVNDFFHGIRQTMDGELNVLSNPDKELDSVLDLDKMPCKDLQIANFVFDGSVICTRNDSNNATADCDNSILTSDQDPEQSTESNRVYIDAIHDNAVVFESARDWQTCDSNDDGDSVTSSNEEFEVHGAQDFENQLVQWVGKHNITHAAVGDLLKILQNHNMNVPACAKTLMKTPRNILIQHKSGGDYKYLGLQCGLTLQLAVLQSNTLLDTLTSLDLSFNIDGLPLFSSSCISLWPILCSITNIPESKPFAVALFSGSQKPSDLNFNVMVPHRCMYCLLRFKLDCVDCKL